MGSIYLGCFLLWCLRGAHGAPDMPFHNSSLTHTEFSRLGSASRWHAWLKSVCVGVWQREMTSSPFSSVCIHAGIIRNNVHVDVRFAVKCLCSWQNHKVTSVPSFTRPDPSRSACFLGDGVCEVDPEGLRVSSWLLFLSGEPSNRNQKLLTLMKCPPSLPDPAHDRFVYTHKRHTLHKRVGAQVGFIAAIQIRRDSNLEFWGTKAQILGRRSNPRIKIIAVFLWSDKWWQVVLGVFVLFLNVGYEVVESGQATQRPGDSDSPDWDCFPTSTVLPLFLSLSLHHSLLPSPSVRHPSTLRRTLRFLSRGNTYCTTGAVETFSVSVGEETPPAEWHFGRRAVIDKTS